MIVPRQTVQLADPGEAADLAAFLARLLHYDRAAAVRLQASGTALAAFGQPPTFGVLAIRTARLAKPYEHGLDLTLDVTVSAGDLLESLDDRAATATVPAPVTGPPWAGLLPPRGGWEPQPGLPAPSELRAVVAGAVAEFKARSAELGAGRTRAELDRIGQDIWSRPVGETDLPLRAVHAAQALGFLREQAVAGAGSGTVAEADGYGFAAGGAEESGGTTTGSGESGGPAASAHGAGARMGAVSLFAAGAWQRLRTPYGSIAVRRAGSGMLSVTPV